MTLSEWSLDHGEAKNTTHLARVTAAIDERLAVTDAVAARLLPEMDERRAKRFRGHQETRKPQTV